jgi:hypothetical protein
MKITIRIYNKNKLIARRIGEYKNWKKLYGKLASALSQNGTRWVVHVDYGKQLNNLGKMERFTNDYDGHYLAEAKFALKAFIER